MEILTIILGVLNIFTPIYMFFIRGLKELDDLFDTFEDVAKDELNISYNNFGNSIFGGNLMENELNDSKNRLKRLHWYLILESYNLKRIRTKVWSIGVTSSIFAIFLFIYFLLFYKYINPANGDMGFKEIILYYIPIIIIFIFNVISVYKIEINYIRYYKNVIKKIRNAEY